MMSTYFLGCPHKVHDTLEGVIFLYSLIVVSLNSLKLILYIIYDSTHIRFALGME